MSDDPLKRDIDDFDFYPDCPQPKADNSLEGKVKRLAEAAHSEIQIVYDPFSANWKVSILDKYNNLEKHLKELHGDGDSAMEAVDDFIKKYEEKRKQKRPPYLCDSL